MSDPIIDAVYEEIERLRQTNGAPPRVVNFSPRDFEDFIFALYGVTSWDSVRVSDPQDIGGVITLRFDSSQPNLFRPTAKDKFKLSLPDGYGIAPHALGQGVLGADSSATSGRTEPFKCTQHTPVTYGTRRGYCSVCDASLEMINFEWREVRNEASNAE